ncbi:hypothetical protein [Acinetobacter sichuanensis]|uniref:Uncharacterized protein n=3 Tax=Acinetobacter sichuanensis TaxID=2136183 RepID=A0A371YJI0_9GAMM|nr:hypothetical protein [Acinetobacter sichuanensis]RFC81514.1 hypothetical protein C9E89_021430 [Acinetobacter sichuanensis]
MSENSTIPTVQIVDLLTEIVNTIQTQDVTASRAKMELLEQLKIIDSKTDTIRTNFPKLIETLSNFDSKIALSFEKIQGVSERLSTVIEHVDVAEKALKNFQQQTQNLSLEKSLLEISKAERTSKELSQNLNRSKTEFYNEINSITTDTLKQFSRIKGEIDTISNIFSTKISTKIIDDVSSSLSKKYLYNLNATVENSSTEFANNFTEKAFDSVKNKVKEQGDEIFQEAQEKLFEIRKINSRIVDTAQASAELFQEQEESFRSYYRQLEKKEEVKSKLGWVLGAVGVLVFLGIFGLLVRYVSDATVEKAINFQNLETKFQLMGFEPEQNRELCQKALNLQFQENPPQLKYCFYLKNPTMQYTVKNDGRNLLIFTK